MSNETPSTALTIPSAVKNCVRRSRTLRSGAPPVGTAGRSRVALCATTPPFCGGWGLSPPRTRVGEGGAKHADGRGRPAILRRRRLSGNGRGGSPVPRHVGDGTTGGKCIVSASACGARRRAWPLPRVVVRGDVPPREVAHPPGEGSGTQLRRRCQGPSRRSAEWPPPQRPPVLADRYTYVRWHHLPVPRHPRVCGGHASSCPTGFGGDDGARPAFASASPPWVPGSPSS